MSEINTSSFELLIRSFKFNRNHIHYLFVSASTISMLRDKYVCWHFRQLSLEAYLCMNLLNDYHQYCNHECMHQKLWRNSKTYYENQLQCGFSSSGYSLIERDRIKAVFENHPSGHIPYAKQPPSSYMLCYNWFWHRTHFSCHVQ